MHTQCVWILGITRHIRHGTCRVVPGPDQPEPLKTRKTTKSVSCTLNEVECATYDVIFCYLKYLLLEQVPALDPERGCQEPCGGPVPTISSK